MKPIGSAVPQKRYHRLGHEGPASDIDVVDVLRAQAHELLESGDVRLLMDRAFRWGYTGADGRERLGLQQVLNALRQRQDELRRQNAEAQAIESTPRECDEFAPDQNSGAQSPEATSREDVRPGKPRSRGSARAGCEDAGSVAQSRGDSDQQSQHGAAHNDAGDVALSDESSGMQAGLRYCHTDTRVDSRDALQRVERALRDLSHIGSVTTLPEIDVQRILAALSPEDADWLLSWQHEAGKARTKAAGAGAYARFELPPAVASAIGADILKSMFRKVTAATAGDHTTWHKGNAGDSVTETSAWEPGEAMDLDLVSTVFHAVRRNPRVGMDGRIAIGADDFQVVRRSATTSVSSVLALDRSRSMGQGGGWVSAKRIALALHELIRRSYPRDSLDLLAFSSKAERVPVNDLPLMSWDRFEHGTNLQGALALARSVLHRRRAGTRQIILVTDGEPTMATGPSGSVFASPPDREVMNATLREVERCTRERIVINLILLTDSDALRRFGDQVARYNNGRVFHASSTDFGASLLKDYVSR